MVLMGSAVKNTKSYFDSKGYVYMMEREDVMRINFTDFDNISEVDILIVFEDDRVVSLSCFNICQVPENKKKDIYEVCSDMNSEYRFVKFYVDEDDNTVTAETDAIITPEVAGEKVFRLVELMPAVIDEAYPYFMRKLWG